MERGGKSKALAEMVQRVRMQLMWNRVVRDEMRGSLVAPFRKESSFRVKGVVEVSPSVVMELGVNRVIEADVVSHKVLRVNGEDVSGIEGDQVLDLSDDGERWEGDVLHNQPCGWGVLYDSENRRVYEGFRLGEVNVCYGRSYYPDIQKVEYEGEICVGKRWGHGILYDRNGNTVFDGEWMNDDSKIDGRVVLTEENLLLHNRVEELVVSDRCFNRDGWRELDLSYIPDLRVLQVGDECFKYVDEVKLIGLKRLERVVIGEECFTRRWGGNDPNRHFYLKDCERLKELKIGCFSFRDYSVCEIERVPSLEGIEMGDLIETCSNFYYASLELRSDSQRVK